LAKLRSAFAGACVRRVLRGKAFAALLAVSALLAPDALESAAANGDTRTLYLFHSHSKESIAATFRINGHYDAATLEKLNWFLRDWRNDEPTHMDPKLFDVLWEAYRANDRMGPDDPIIVVSAYRCPATNAMLRRRSRAVARHSQHMLGKAMDTTMPGLSMEKLREVAMRMQRGGVGYYPTANTPFVHIDVGNVRHWPRMSYDQLAELFPDGKTVHIPSNGKLLPGYEEARAEILARGGEAVTVAEAKRSGGGLRGFFAFLFGGGGEDEDEARTAAPEVRPALVANAAQGQPPADAGEDEGGEAARLEPQRRMMANAETDLPRGETYMGAPPAVSPAPAPAPAVSAPSKPEPVEPPPSATNPPGPAAAQPAALQAEPPAEKPSPLDDAPAPPRRPADMDSLVADAPLPPPRPAGLAALPEVIAHGADAKHGAGAKQALRASAEGGAALSYAAAPASRRQPPAGENTDAEATPLPPPRPSAKALRPAAAAKAERNRAARAAASQMAPARADWSALAPSLGPASRRAIRPAAAPALRAAARDDVLVGAPVGGAAERFDPGAATPNARAFSRTAE
jgi:uncharacterized protein YcbK (DUF882 family)